jgi:hypothetical protein
MDRLFPALLEPTSALLIQVAVIHVQSVPTALAALMSQHAAVEVMVIPQDLPVRQIALYVKSVTTALGVYRERLAVTGRTGMSLARSARPPA